MVTVEVVVEASKQVASSICKKCLKGSGYKLCLQVSLSLYIYIYMYVSLSLSLYVYIYIYICVCIYIYRERENIIMFIIVPRRPRDRLPGPHDRGRVRDHPQRGEPTVCGIR